MMTEQRLSSRNGWIWLYLLLTIPCRLRSHQRRFDPQIRCWLTEALGAAHLDQAGFRRLRILMLEPPHLHSISPLLRR
jgi:hypothetical protein